MRGLANLTHQGTLYRLPGEVVYRTPQEGLADTILLGDTERVSDRRTASTTQADWRGGMGEEQWEAQQGVSTFTVSDCDTRYRRALVCRPLAANLVSVGALSGTGWRVDHLGYATADVILWRPSGKAYRYDPGVPSWTDLAGTIAGLTVGGVVRTLGYTYLANYAGGVYRSTDGAAWTSLGLVVGGAHGLAEHDNKLYTLEIDAAFRTYTLRYTADPTAATPTWATGGTFRVEPNREAVIQLYEWRAAAQPKALYALTNRRIWVYNDDSATWQKFYEFPNLGYGAFTGMWAHVWERDDNLYVAVGPNADYLLQFTGATVDRLGPNRRGGLAAADRVSAVALAGNGINLFVAGGPPAWTSNEGRALAMNEQAGFHSMHRRAGQTVVGVGWGNSSLYSVYADGGVYRQTVRDAGDAPHYATGLSYDAAALVHEEPWDDGGTPHIPKAARWSELHSINPDSSPANRPGLAPGASILVEYQLDRSGTWVTLGTLTDASVFPARLDYGNDITYYEIKRRYTLTRGTATTATPVVVHVSHHYVRRLVPQRFSFGLRVDLSDTGPYETLGLPQVNGRSLAQIRAALGTMVDSRPLVAFAYGPPLPGGLAPDPSHTEYVSVASAELTWGAQEDMGGGRWVATLTLKDVSTPASG